MRLLIVLLVLFITAPSFAQIGETEVKEDPILVGRVGVVPKLQYKETDAGRYYTLLYNNAKYSITDIKAIGWLGDEEDLEYVYNFILEGIGNKEDRSLKVGDDTMRTYPYGKKTVSIYIDHKNDTDGNFYINKKGLDKLFGKTK